MLVHIFIGTDEDLLILRGPRSILVFRAIHAGLVTPVFVLRLSWGVFPERRPVSVGRRTARTIRSPRRASPGGNGVWWLE